MSQYMEKTVFTHQISPYFYTTLTPTYPLHSPPDSLSPLPISILPPLVMVSLSFFLQTIKFLEALVHIWVWVSPLLPQVQKEKGIQIFTVQTFNSNKKGS